MMSTIRGDIWREALGGQKIQVKVGFIIGSTAILHVSELEHNALFWPFWLKSLAPLYYKRSAPQ